MKRSGPTLTNQLFTEVMSVFFHIRLRQLLIGLVALAMLSLPFAHRTGAAPLTQEMAEYLALGGDVSDICGDSGTSPAGGCESCRISASMLFAFPQPKWRAAQMQTVLQLIQTSQFHGTKSVTDSPHPPRAPPLA